MKYLEVAGAVDQQYHWMKINVRLSKMGALKPKGQALEMTMSVLFPWDPEACARGLAGVAKIWGAPSSCF